MALQGTLDAFGLVDVLHLLADTAKTGCLQVDGEGGRGRVWVHDGGIVGVEADGADRTAPVDHVLFELLRHDHGSFRFTADGHVPDDGMEPQRIDVVLGAATSLLEEWREMAKVVPSIDCEVTLVPELDGDQVTIDAERWATLARIGPGAEIAHLAATMGLNELDVTRIVCDLVDHHLVEVRPAMRRHLGRSDAPHIPAAEVPLSAGF